jgi:hypothetical protein
MTGLLSFAAASFLAFVASSAVSVFLLGQVEPAWGRGGSFQVLCIASAIATVLVVVGFGVGAAIARRFPAARVAAVLGAACALLFVAVLAVAAILGADPKESLFLLAALPLLGGVAPLLRRRAPGAEALQA